jgi:hypothetical protein
MRSTTKLSAALAALAIAVALVAPAAYATPVDPVSAAVVCDPSAVPPPPSLMAASAAKEYALLRACGAQDDKTTVVSTPVHREPSPPVGFDWVSAAIGAAAAAGLSLVAMATLGMRRHAASA